MAIIPSYGGFMNHDGYGMYINQIAIPMYNQNATPMISPFGVNNDITSYNAIPLNEPLNEQLQHIYTKSNKNTNMQIAHPEYNL